MPLKPESTVQVTVAGTWLAVLHPDGEFQRIALPEIQAVYFESSEGPFGIDWWIVEGPTPDSRCVFPLGATGETEAVEWLKQLEGFQVSGMNSISNQRFLCWKKDGASGVQT